jgi:hypothetical protein
MKNFLSLIVIFGQLYSPAQAQFVGQLTLAPQGCQASGYCRLIHDFGYYDPRGIGWQAQAGLQTDGASIPTLAQPFIGSPWDEEFVRAAVLHDHYCIRTVRARTQTHRMFYDALVESGVSRAKAGVMYYAVLIGSHMWINLTEGQPCSGMDACIRNIGGRISVPGTVVRSNNEGQRQAYRPPRFQDPAFQSEIAAAGAIILSGTYDNGVAIEALARQRNPTDFFLNNGDSIAYEDNPSMGPAR